MSAPTIRPIVLHEFALLRRNTMMWFRFALFYFVFGAMMVRAVRTQDWEDLSIILAGLMVLAAVGIATTLSAEAFAQEKERGTMEALLLAPLSATALVQAKLAYVAVTAMGGVLLCLATGPILILLLGNATDITRVLNRTAMVTAFGACPPAIVIAGAIGTIISCRARSLQNASAATALSGMLGMLVAISVAFALSTRPLAVALLVVIAAWSVAFFTYRIARASVSPQVMTRTRGR